MLKEYSWLFNFQPNVYAPHLWHTSDHYNNSKDWRLKKENFHETKQVVHKTCAIMCLLKPRDSFV